MAEEVLSVSILKCFSFSQIRSKIPVLAHYPSQKKKKKLTPVISLFLGTGAIGVRPALHVALVEHYCAPSTVLYMQVLRLLLLRLKTSKLNELSFMAAPGAIARKKDLHVTVGG